MPTLSATTLKGSKLRKAIELSKNEPPQMMLKASSIIHSIAPMVSRIVCAIGSGYIKDPGAATRFMSGA
jgi:hypothetical protein